MSGFAPRSADSVLLSSTPSRSFIGSEYLQPRADPRCGSQFNGVTCDSVPLNSCCSQYGCQLSLGCQSGCMSTVSPSDGQCGSAFGGAVCQNGCCSKNGYCGNTDEYCLITNGCQSGCTNGSDGTSTSTGTAGSLFSGAKIGIITGGAVFGACLISIGLYTVWRHKRRRQKTIDLDSDLESEADSVLVPDLMPIQGLTKICMGCLEMKSAIAGFPRRRITAGCNHEPRLCRQCLERRINISLAQQGWDEIRCPENACGLQLQSADVQEFASLDDDQRYLARRRRTETRECQICIHDRIVATEFPYRPVTDQCQHELACKECIIGTIRAAIDEGRWTNVVCPLCPNELEFKDIADFAADEDFARYDRLETRRAMEQIPNFRWCLRESCASGQIHDLGEQLMLCNACGYEMCYIHERPWHAGLTCQEYEDRNEQRLRSEEAAVRAVISRTTRPCPSCRVNVEKVEGTCNHMTCRPPVGCGHEFCYECLVRWRGYGRRTTHERTCSSYMAT